MEKTLSHIQTKALSDLESVSSTSDLDQLKSQLLGKQSPITAILKEIPSLPLEKRAIIGRLANTIKQKLVNIFKSRNFDVKNIDGHSFDEIIDAFAYHSERESSQPLAIIANTIKGKGVSYMENEAAWHYGVPTGELFQKALNEIENMEESS